MADEIQERLARLRAKWAELRSRCDGDEECPHDSGNSLYAQINPNGSRFVFEGCASCGKRVRSGEWIDQKRTPGAAGAPVVADLRLENPPCQVCGAWGTELHHWAPRSVFRHESDHWPTSWLCPGCHTYWHDAMNKVAQEPAQLKLDIADAG